MKLCARCKQWWPRDAFTRNVAKRDGLQGCCRDCQRAYMRSHYLANREYYLAKAKRSNNKRRTLVRHLLQELKAVPCADCGVEYPSWVMEFDHVRGVKLFNVGEALLLHPDAVLAEAAKCEIVCSNCHQHRTWQRFIARP